MLPLQSPFCSQCGYAFPSKIIQSSKPLCGNCRRNLFLFDFARSFATFHDPLKEIIHQFKYRSHRSLARPLAHLLHSAYRLHFEQLASDAMIAVPMHPSRERERGFNQTAELCKHFSRSTHIPIEQVLLRKRPTKVQAGLSRRERRLNLRGAFKVSRKERIEGRSLLLIDDVFTTGATVNECAKILKESGARRVHVLTVARVIRE